ncbi:[acyl-carrier-protein] S-malonyltransferase [candidate division WOR-1 bacterium RIFCSPHIGHO2_01_FULL_53_15]|uniref:Malonyl CoA-acyl carrier protein transacylase n=1 Tax=candidate division WOR-1 bacterium RIFCSPHIGHO2_01_FULL_53_15 TaxID=1802564 RepID=A0A1F4PZE2_UNCSA|nr:MAG: [acyl-carrier-protein] S-malonyltransferase [candidate division WOR-1 bacterium RIFCSPHIGHO2_01_FULL_53_15]
MKTAFVFPGQGSQSVGMGKGFAEKLLEQANQILGFDLKKIVLEGPEEELIKTEIQQPAIFTVSVAALEESRKQKAELGTQVAAVAGHSLGEYSALYSAGAISFEDGVKTVHLRGKFMQAAVPAGEGAMAALLGGDRDAIINICKGVGGVWPANFNSPGQIVISGKKSSVEAAGEKLKAAGVKKIIPLAVSAPFHCPLMQPAADKLAIELEKITINDAKIPVYANVTAAPVKSGAEIKQLLVKQVTAPVLWEDSIKKMIADGVTSFIEVGPGKVLTGLIKKTDPNVEVKSYVEA